jgi:hypothetical protein
MQPKSLLVLGTFAASCCAQLSGTEIVTGIDGLKNGADELNTHIKDSDYPKQVSHSHIHSLSTLGKTSLADFEPKDAKDEYVDFTKAENSFSLKLADTEAPTESEQVAQICASFDKVHISSL